MSHFATQVNGKIRRDLVSNLLDYIIWTQTLVFVCYSNDRDNQPMSHLEQARKIRIYREGSRLIFAA